MHENKFIQNKIIILFFFKQFLFQKTFQMNKTFDSDLAPHFYASGHDKV